MGRIPRSASAGAAKGEPAPGPGGGRRTGPRPDPGTRLSPITRGGAFPTGSPSRGRARGQWPCQSASGGKGEPPLPSRSREQPPPAPARTFNSSERQLAQGCGRAGPSPSRGGRSRRKYGGGSLRPAAAPLSWGGGPGRRGPDGRCPELLLRSSVWTAVPGNRRRNCHSPPPSAPAASASSSHFFLPPPARPATAHRPRAVRHGVTPTGPAAGGSGRLSFARVGSPGALPRSPRLRPWWRAWPRCPPLSGEVSEPQDFAWTELSWRAGVFKGE